MPTSTTYPGVYIEEIPSGVRTITGVSTSVTAFVGAAKRGPIDKAVHILSYADFERRFGGLDADSFMSYAVRQFFMNGGSDAWVIRLAGHATLARRILKDSANPSQDIMTITALDAGKAGKNIDVAVDYATPNPDSTFSLTVSYNSRDNPEENTVERYPNLSMNRQDPRSVFTVIAEGVSRLVKVEPVTDYESKLPSGKGNSISGNLVDAGNNPLDPATLLKAVTSYQMQISVNGLDPVTVTITKDLITGSDSQARWYKLCSLISSQLNTQPVEDKAILQFKCTYDTTDPKIPYRVILESGDGGENSSVRVSPGTAGGLASVLKLGPLWGGKETDAVASLRPVEMPGHGILTSGPFPAALDKDILTTTGNQFYLSLDGANPELIVLDPSPLPIDLNGQLTTLAPRIQTSVRKCKPGKTAFDNFNCTADSGNNTLVLASGTRGDGSSVAVNAAAGNDAAGLLNLTTAANPAPGTDANLNLDGNEDAYKEEKYDLYIASRKDKMGIYALEDVDLFNILCLPGVSDPGILADAAAYCKERRAFLIIDAPYDQRQPDKMVTLVAGTALPKTEYAAVYYPWIMIPDPLKNSTLKLVPPSGTIAGLYARTDSARGVWKAPAGTEATLAGVQKMDYALSDPENGTLNPLGVNCLRIKPVYGAICWGARTLRGADDMTSEWKYIPVRRLASFIEESLFRGTQWVVFEPNDEPLWAQIRLNIGAFMHNLFVQGAFQGTSPKDAYFVKCDKETTTQTDINAGVVNIVVGFAPLKPAEFVIIKIQQITGQIQT
jgi:phage tail sheath protein FI